MIRVPDILKHNTNLVQRYLAIREFGIKKYNSDTWDEVPLSKLLGASLRHYYADLLDSGGNDLESGLPHVDHLLCNMTRVMELKKAGTEEDLYILNLYPNALSYLYRYAKKGTIDNLEQYKNSHRVAAMFALQRRLTFEDTQNKIDLLGTGILNSFELIAFNIQ